MAQQLIAINGNEEFPYLLKPEDISEAMGLAATIAPGGFSTAGAIDTTNIADSSGNVNLTDSAWNNVVKLDSSITNVYLPASSPTNAVIQFYPMAEPTGDTNSTWILWADSGNGQYINFIAGGIDNRSAIEVPYNSSLTLLSRGNGELNIIGGTYILTNNTGNNQFLGDVQVDPSRLCRNNVTNENLLQNGNWQYGLNAGWSYSSPLEIVAANTFARSMKLELKGPVSQAFTITSDNIVLPVQQSGGVYLFSGLVYNQGTDTSGNNELSDVYTMYFYINYYDSSNTLLGSTELFNVPSGFSGYQFFQSNPITFNSITINADYVNITVVGSTFPGQTYSCITELKLELTCSTSLNPHALTYPTLFSNESSIRQYSKNTFSGSGYQKMPSGMIMQWGAANNSNQNGSTPATANFPLAFPNNVFQVVMTDTSDNAYRYWTTNYTQTGFSFGALETDASTTDVYATSGSATGSYIAFGW